MRSRFLRFVGPISILFLGVALLVRQAQSAPEPPAVFPEWGTGPGSRLSDLNNTAVGPVVEYSPDGTRLMVVYLQDNGAGHRTPTFRTSTTDGLTWNSATAIPGNVEDATWIDLFITANNVAHVVWVENKPASPPTGNAWLYYRNYNLITNSWSSRIQLATINYSGPPGIDRAVIGAKDANTIDVVWSQQDYPTSGDNMNLLHKRSTNGGSSFWTTPSLVADTVFDSREPSLQVDNAGALHVVWEDGGSTSEVIYYSTGVVLSTVSVWLPSPINVAAVTNSKQPYLALNGNTKQVFYSEVVPGAGQNDPDKHYLHYTSCTNGCETIGNWVPVANPISGPTEFHVNDNFPIEVIKADVEIEDGCTYIYFHGIDLSNQIMNEVISGVNNCDGWGVLDSVTPETARVIRPNIASNGKWMILVHERQDTLGVPTSVLFMRGEMADDGIYLPIIIRN